MLANVYFSSTPSACRRSLTSSPEAGKHDKIFPQCSLIQGHLDPNSTFGEKEGDPNRAGSNYQYLQYDFLGA